VKTFTLTGRLIGCEQRGGEKEKAQFASVVERHRVPWSQVTGLYGQVGAFEGHEESIVGTLDCSA